MAGLTVEDDFGWCLILGSATVPVALAGVSPASLRRLLSFPTLEPRRTARVFGETPKTAVGTTALPKANESFPLSLTHF